MDEQINHSIGSEVDEEYDESIVEVNKKRHNNLRIYMIIFAVLNIIGVVLFFVIGGMENQAGQSASTEIENSSQPKIILNDLISKTHEIKTIFGLIDNNLTGQSVSESKMLNFAFRIGKEYGALEFCDKFRFFRGNFHSVCYAGVAISSNDNSLCKKVPSGDEATKCFSILAYLKKDPFLCEDVVKGHQEYCLLQAGYGIKDYERCENSKLPSESYWTSLYYKPVDSCKVGVGIALKDLDVCEKVKGIADYKCYPRLATETREIGVCDKLGSKKSIERCYMSVAEVTQDYEICKKVSDPRCFYEILKHDPDLGVCELYKNKLSTMTCYEKVALKKKDFSICEKIRTLSEYLDAKKYAEESKNENVLKYMHPENKVDYCIKEVAERTRNKELCDQVKDKESCLDEIYEMDKKLEYCELITNEDLKNECIKLIESKELNKKSGSEINFLF